MNLDKKILIINDDSNNNSICSTVDIFKKTNTNSSFEGVIKFK